MAVKITLKVRSYHLQRDSNFFDIIVSRKSRNQEIWNVIIVIYIKTIKLFKA